MNDIRDIYSRITNKIIADLEQGVRPWLKPWSSEHAAGRISRPLRHNGIPYQGINVVMLWSAATTRGYACPLWLTFRQALELGGAVRTGETGELIVYANRITRTETDDKGEELEREIPFHEGLHRVQRRAVRRPARAASAPRRRPLPSRPADRHGAGRPLLCCTTGADIRQGGTRAYYAAGCDHVQMPPFETFRDAESHAATLAHELTHWTKHPARLARDFGRMRFGDEGYATEELVAELGIGFPRGRPRRSRRRCGRTMPPTSRPG